MHPLDATTEAYNRAAFFGHECAIAMLLGREQLAYDRAQIAFRWAVQTGRVWREATKDQ